jgi:predicted nicotinamide N-methyase
MEQMNIDAPFWAFAWIGGQALGRYIPDDSEAVAGLNVIDIGSGKQSRIETREAAENGYSPARHSRQAHGSGQ